MVVRMKCNIARSFPFSDDEFTIVNVDLAKLILLLIVITYHHDLLVAD